MSKAEDTNVGMVGLKSCLTRKGMQEELLGRLQLYSGAIIGYKWFCELCYDKAF